MNALIEIRRFIVLPLLILCSGLTVQSQDFTLSNTSGKKTFSNSESPDFTFIVRSDIKSNELLVETNYERDYKVRFIDYYARTSKVFKGMHSSKKIDLSEFDRSIFIVKFVDQRNNKVLSSQILNLKKKL